jgi:hypothetical protein
VTIGSLTFDDSFANDIVGIGSLRLEASGSTPGRIYVVQGDHKISVPLTLASNTAVDIADHSSISINNLSILAGKSFTRTGAPDSTLTIKGVQSHEAGAVMNINAGTLNLNTNAGSAASAPLTLNVNATTVHLGASQDLAALNVTGGGSVNVIASPLSTIKTNQLNVAGGTLELSGAKMAVAYSGASPIDQINSWVAADKITSSTATGLLALGVADATDVSAVLLATVRAGDADLSGSINADDYFKINTGYSRSLHGYANGDFDYSGTIDGDDFFLIDANFGQPGAGVGAVPEPTCGLIALMALPWFQRRRRHFFCAAS